MLSIIIPVYKGNCNLKKTLISILLQNSIEKIKVILVFKNEDTMDNYNNIIKLFSGRVNLLCCVASDKNLRQYGLNKCKTKYVTFLRPNDFFYDAFSVEFLMNEICKKKFDFIFGEYVELNDDNIYSNINNYYLSANGKIFLVDYLKKNNIKIADVGDFDVEFVSKCFLLSKKYDHIDNIICVNNSFELDIFSNIKVIVDGVLNVYHLYEDKLEVEELNNYIFYNFDYLNSLFVRNVFRIPFADYQMVIAPLEMIYRKIIEEV